MIRARFLGVGLPPRPIPCARCGQMLRMDGDAFFDEGVWSSPLYCSESCFVARYASNQPTDVGRLDAGAVDNEPPTDDHPAVGEDLW